MPQLSVVIPVYGCAGCLRPLHARLTATLETITGDYEMILVDDRSKDGAWPVLVELAERDPHLTVVRLSRNFGQHAAITAGLARSRGDWTVVMDCDLQEPPEEIARLWAAAQDGVDVVRTAREGRRHAAWRRWASRMYRRLLLESDRDVEYSTLSMISRKVVDVFLQLPERDREYQLVLDWLGFSQTTLRFTHAGRGDDTPSAYGLDQLVRVAFDGLFFRTTVLLRVIVLLGFAVAGAGGLLAVFAVYSRLTTDTPAGYTSLVVLLLVLSGFVLISLGVVGLYVGRIFDQVKGRPIYVVDEEVLGTRRSLEAAAD